VGDGWRVPHTVKAFDEDLEAIRRLIGLMGESVEEALVKSVDALIDH
jgi:phosphate uptake regulator